MGTLFYDAKLRIIGESSVPGFSLGNESFSTPIDSNNIMTALYNKSIELLNIDTSLIVKDEKPANNILPLINHKINMTMFVCLVRRIANLVKRSKVIANVLNGRLGYVNQWRSLIRGMSRKDVEMAWAALERMGITDQAQKRADELSGGQQQRVGIARVLVQEPKIILADEPVASLDPVLAHSILQHLEDLNQQEGITVVCSLHYIDLVQRYATSVIGLRDGEIVYKGTRADIRAMTDQQFRDIYGEQAERVGSGLEGTVGGAI